MARVYLSSTYEDLSAHRDAVTVVLRKMQHEVVGMEDHTSGERGPLDRCLEDVRRADVYVGLLAWRYGFIPDGYSQSITELEYLEAGQHRIPRLLFLLREDVPWPPHFIDAVGSGAANSPIGKLRERMRSTHTVRAFESPDDLAGSVAAAVSVEVATSIISSRKRLFVELAEAHPDQVWSSSPPSLLWGIVEARGSSIVAIDFGTTVWWSTRLLLLSLLARDWTELDAVLFLKNDEFVGVATVEAIRTALSEVHPRLRQAYSRRLPTEREQNHFPSWRGERERAFPVDRMDRLLFKVLEDELDENEKFVVSRSWLRGVLGDSLTVAQVEAPVGPAGALQLYEIVNKSSQFVAMLRDGRVTGVVNRIKLQSQLALMLIRQELGG